MLRYLRRLEHRDLSLTTSMIPLGSCTMKLNATGEMLPITWPDLPGFIRLPPADRRAGYQMLFSQLEQWLGRNHRFYGGVTAAQCGFAGRIRRAVSHPSMPCGDAASSIAMSA